MKQFFINNFFNNFFFATSVYRLYLYIQNVYFFDTFLFSVFLKLRTLCSRFKVCDWTIGHHHERKLEHLLGDFCCHP